MPGLGDHQRRPRADHLGALAQDRLDVTRIAVAGQLVGAFGRLDLLEADHPALRFRDDLLGDDEDVGVLEASCPFRCLRQQRHEIVALLDLRDALEREDPDAGRHGKPVTRMPACAL